MAYNLETDLAGGAISVQAVGKVNGETVELGTPILRLVDPTSVETTESGLTLSVRVPGKVTEVEIIAALVDSSASAVLASATINYPTLSRTLDVAVVAHENGFKAGHPVNGEVERGSAVSGSQIWFPVRLSI